MLTLLGIAVVVVGFLIRINPLLVIAAAALVTGLAAGMDPVRIIAVFGKAFNESRYVTVVFIVLPVIGLLERFGLQERARTLIAKLRGATTGRLLIFYLGFRQIMAAVGLASATGGQAQIVRPLLAPMAEAAAETRYGLLPQKTRDLIRAHAAAADNVGVFFGEDIFLAIGSILLIKGFLEQNGIIVQPLALSVWAIPTAVCAFLIHGTRLLLLERQLGSTVSISSANTDPGTKPLNWNGWFTLFVPNKWIVETTDEATSAFDPAGAGALTISAFSRSSDVTEGSKEIALSFAVKQGASETEVTTKKLSKFSDAVVARFLSIDADSSTSWNVAVICRDSQVALISYNAPTVQSEGEQAVVDRVLKSFRWEVLP